MAVWACIDQALTDIARYIPPKNVEEIKRDALNLRSSYIGTNNYMESNKSTYKGKRNNQHYIYEHSLTAQLIGRNGLSTGWWPQLLDSQQAADALMQTNNRITQKQMASAFDTQPKEKVVGIYPKLQSVYNKYEAAISFYSEKIAVEHATKAARLLIEDDFEKVAHNQELSAVTEMPLERHHQILEQIKIDLKVEGKSSNLLENNPSKTYLTNALKQLQEQTDDVDQVAIKDNKPSLDDIYAELQNLKSTMANGESASLDKSIQSIEETIKALLQTEKDNQEKAPADVSYDQSFEYEKVSMSEASFDVSTLNSTAIPLGLNSLFSSGYQTEEIKGSLIKKQWDVNELKHNLSNRAEELVLQLLGEPKIRDKNQLRFGSNKGSLVITTNGAKKGYWYDHQEGKGGDLLSLIMQKKLLSFKEALEFAGEFLSIEPAKAYKTDIDLSDLKDASINDDKKEKIRYARLLANQSKPLEGTLAAKYLKNIRHVDASLCSENVRFLSSVKEPETGDFHPALLVIGKNLEGKVQGAQVTYLTDNGEKLHCEHPKRSYGLIKGTAIPVRLGGNIYGVAEGIETALSIATANPKLTMFASLGSITNFSEMDIKSNNNTLIIFADNDINNQESIKKLDNAASELINKGFNVFTCTPEKPGQDFNDVIIEQGINGVNRHMKNIKLLKLPAKETEVSKVSDFKKEKYRSKKYLNEKELGI